jgi:hypothetical protein
VLAKVVAAVPFIPVGLFVAPAIVINYAEPRFREDPEVSTELLAAQMAS